MSHKGFPHYRAEAGAFPEYELALQVFTEEQAAGFGFDVLDSTKIIPEELVPLQVIGRMTLDRWPDNFFALPSAALGIGGLVAAFTWSSRPWLHTLDMPVLVLHGTDGPASAWAASCTRDAGTPAACRSSATESMRRGSVSGSSPWTRDSVIRSWTRLVSRTDS